MSSTQVSPRELIVCLSLDVAMRRSQHEALGAALKAAGASLVPLGAEVESFGVPLLPGYYRALASDTQLDALAEQVRGLPGVRGAYIKPGCSLAVYEVSRAAVHEAPPASPNYTTRQGYLLPAPVGVDAAFLWTLPGGDGAGVGVVDIEGAWRFSHEDLAENKGGVIGGISYPDLHWRNHGTAVLGVIGGDRNQFGVTGIAPASYCAAASIFGGTGSAGAVLAAVSHAKPGDIILIELHRPGPRAGGWGQQGFIPIEWWPDDFEALQYATQRGILVVEAGGNGAENLDHPDYDKPARGFPSDWRNPFRRQERDSGAILVGAGSPPPGTHGRSHGPDRSRLDFSNYGAALDVQGWGREVTTCGYGDLQGGKDEDRWYSDTFSGTSSASPVVVGSLCCLQGALRASGRPVLTPASARRLLRETGSLQTDAPGRPASQRIGNRPDLRAAWTLLSRP
jgi:hypothetical protein